MADTRDLIIADASAVPLPPPTLVNGEDAAAYAQLAARIRAAVAPVNIIEEIWARDVADLTWDVVRLRRLKAGLYTIGASDGMTQILCGLEKYAITGQLKARDWAARKPAALAEVNSQLSTAGLDMGDVATSTFAVRIDQFDRIERMLAAAEVRRAAALHAIDNRRAAERARAAAEEAERAAAPPIEAGEFTLVPETGAGPATQSGPA
jgi:hypothetical protein